MMWAMPSIPHEAPIELLRVNPQLASAPGLGHARRHRPLRRGSVRL